MSDLVEKMMDLFLGIFVRSRVVHVAMEQEHVVVSINRRIEKGRFSEP